MILRRAFAHTVVAGCILTAWQRTALAAAPHEDVSSAPHGPLETAAPPGVIAGFVQARATLASNGDPLLSLPRTRLYALGALQDERLQYRLMMGTNGVDTAVQVFDAYAEVRFASALRVRVGRTKLPVFRAWVTSARELAFSERDAATVALLPGREVAVMALGDVASSRVEYALAAFDSGDDSKDLRAPALAARLVLNLLGRPLAGEVDLEDSPFSLAIGASATTLRRRSVSLGGTNERVGEHVGGAEVLVRARGFDLGAEVELRNRRRSNDEHLDVRSGYARAAYFVAPARTSFGLRVTTIRGTDPSLPRRDELAVDAVVYAARHDLKVVGEFAAARVGESRDREGRGVLQLQFAF